MVASKPSTSFRDFPLVERLHTVSDRASMSGLMHEPRTPVMIVVQASWEEPGGAVQTLAARMEDRSVGGALIRLSKAVSVGSQLTIRSHREQFSGVSKYCRRDGKDFLVGIQKDKAVSSISERVSPQAVPVGEEPISQPPVQASETPAKAHPAVEKEISAGRAVDQRALLPSAPSADRGTLTAQTKPSPTAQEKQAYKVRTSMRNKLLELAHWRSKHDDENGNGNSENGDHSLPTAPAEVVAPAAVAANFEVELLPVEEIYRASGVMNVRHNIHRVVDMLHSEHIRGLTNEMKRAAVLMALDAAGIAVDQVVQDAKARQNALDFYEADQKKQVEAKWARKAEENIQIQAELDRLKEHYMARIARNLESVDQEKVTFGDWLEKKQQESQSISEAASLFVKPAVPELAVGPALLKN
jgi:hypothetical protein